MAPKDGSLQLQGVKNSQLVLLGVLGERWLLRPEADAVLVIVGDIVSMSGVLVGSA